MSDTFELLGAVASRVVERLDPYHYWQSKLAGEDPDPPEDRTQMPAGFWCLRSGDPLAVWLNGTERVALRGFKGSERVMGVRHMETMAESGSFGLAVTEDAYRDAFEKGSWADDPPPVTGIGHNLPDDPFEAARLELADEEETTAAFLAKPVETQADADKCATWKKRLGQLKTRADEEFEKEKRPLWLAGKAVDDKWGPVRKGAKELTDRLARHLDPWLKRQQREADAIAAKAREEAEQLRRAADLATVNEDERAELIFQAQEVERAAVPKKAIAGRPNMRVSLRRKTRARIVDYPACYAALRDHRDMREFVEQLANRAVKAGVPLAGVEVEEYEEAA
jgi:hypothetical protein